MKPTFSLHHQHPCREQGLIAAQTLGDSGKLQSQPQALPGEHGRV